MAPALEESVGIVEVLALLLSFDAAMSEEEERSRVAGWASRAVAVLKLAAAAGVVCGVWIRLGSEGCLGLFTVYYMAGRRWALDGPLLFTVSSLASWCVRSLEGRTRSGAG
jgi:uncharacterized membrane protein YphA (DoxX/SURF4 family)